MADQDPPNLPGSPDDGAVDATPPSTVGTWSPFIEDANTERRKALLIALPVGVIIVLLAVIILFRPKGGSDGPADVRAIDGASTTVRVATSFSSTSTTRFIDTTLALTPTVVGPVSTSATSASTVGTAGTTASTASAKSTTTATTRPATTTAPARTATVGLSGKIVLAGQRPTTELCQPNSNPGEEFRIGGKVDVISTDNVRIGGGTLTACDTVEAVADQANERWTFTASSTRVAPGKTYSLRVCPSNPTQPVVESGKDAYAKDDFRTDRKDPDITPDCGA